MRLQVGSSLGHPIALNCAAFVFPADPELAAVSCVGVAFACNDGVLHVSARETHQHEFAE
jgi:hypothetical protein